MWLWDCSWVDFDLLASHRTATAVGPHFSSRGLVPLLGVWMWAPTPCLHLAPTCVSEMRWRVGLQRHVHAVSHSACDTSATRAVCPKHWKIYMLGLFWLLLLLLSLDLRASSCLWGRTVCDAKSHRTRVEARCEQSRPGEGGVWGVYGRGRVSSLEDNLTAHSWTLDLWRSNSLADGPRVSVISAPWPFLSGCSNQKCFFLLLLFSFLCQRSYICALQVDVL